VLFEERRVVFGRIAIVAAGIVVTSALHYVTPPSLLLWHNVFQRLYYLPIIFAALYFGWKGGLAAAGATAVCYIPHIFRAWHHFPGYEINQYAEIILFLLVGSVTGVLADRERKQRRKLQEATEQLTRVYRELQDSFEQLKRADRLSAVGQLAASLAHEIRNPLGSIEGAADILEKPQTSPELCKEFLGIIRKESRRLNRLLTNLLDFARPRRPEFQAVGLEPLIDSVITLLSPTAQLSGITLRKSMPVSVPALESDPEQIRQVVLNLTMNAIQAMPEGGEVELAVEPGERDITIAVTDQGGGVAPEDLDKIFDPFFTTKENGTGLGLSVAHRIVDQHGGVLSAKRNEDRGMTFSIVLPRKPRSVN